MVVFLGRVDSLISELNGVWYVATSEERLKPFRIVFWDTRKSVCLEYIKMLTGKRFKEEEAVYGIDY